MAGVASVLVDIITWLVYFIWTKWTIEIVVLFSFVLQLVLFFLAGDRRRHDFGFVRGLIWVSYQLADYFATYGLGHLSVSTLSVPWERQQLVAFWAPFLLLHLGGPDSITAYTLEDNSLWMRQLLVNFFPQVVGAAYVLIQFFPVGRSGFLFPAAWLMFTIGAAKYGERIWALYSGNLDSIRSTVEEEQQQRQREEEAGGRPELADTGRPEYPMLYAHSKFWLCKGLLVDSSYVKVDPSELGKELFSQEWEWEDKWKVIQMEVSLLYDIMYTKAGVIHTWHGYCIRVVSPLATAGALLLFHFHLSTTSDGGSAVLVDIAITYTLLVGAILLDMVSLVSAAGSTWAYAYLVSKPPARRHGWLYHTAVCNRRWHRLHRVLVYIRRIFKADDGRRWSGEIGQYNMLLQNHVKKGRAQKLAKKMGLQGASTASIPPRVMKLIIDNLFLCLTVTTVPALKSMGVLKIAKGQRAVEKHRVYRLHLFRSREIQEGILVWHIATNVFLRLRSTTRETPREEEDENSETTQLQLKAIELLSNYMMFLLVERPHMLPGLALRRQYKETSEHLERIRTAGEGDGNLANMLHTSTGGMTEDTALRGSALGRAARLARTLLDYNGQPVKVEFLFEMWVELLLNVSHQCSRESHAKQLSNGGELTTLVWLMAELAGKFYIDKEIKLQRQRLRHP